MNCLRWDQANDILQMFHQLSYQGSSLSWAGWILNKGKGISSLIYKAIGTCIRTQFIVMEQSEEWMTMIAQWGILVRITGCIVSSALGAVWLLASLSTLLFIWVTAMSVAPLLFLVLLFRFLLFVLFPVVSKCVISMCLLTRHHNSNGYWLKQGKYVWHPQTAIYSVGPDGWSGLLKSLSHNGKGKQNNSKAKP